MQLLPEVNKMKDAVFHKTCWIQTPVSCLAAVGANHYTTPHPHIRIIKPKICVRVYTRSKKSAADVLEFFLMPKGPNLAPNLPSVRFFNPLTLLRFHSVHVLIPYHFQGSLQSVYYLQHVCLKECDLQVTLFKEN